MAALGQTTDPKALIPGTPANVLADARAMQGRANHLDGTATALGRVRTPGSSSTRAQRCATRRPGCSSEPASGSATPVTTQ